jgi:phospholipid/cholesterol/gamma-HCH transport system substrate-binding protein
VRWLSRLTTAAVIAVIALAVVALIRARMPQTRVGGEFQTWALFRDGTRLSRGSPVVIAGVRVGEVVDLSIVDTFARVDMRLADDTRIPYDSWVTRRASSAFGDSFIEIIPTAGAPGSPTARRLRSGERLINVIEGSSTEQVLRAVARAMPQVDQGLARLHEVSWVGRKWTSGELAESILDAERWLDEGHVRRPLTRVDQAMERIEAATTGAARSLGGAGPDIDRTLARIARGTADTRAKIRELDADLREGLQQAREGLDRLELEAGELADVLAEIDGGEGDRGRGTLARLIASPELANDLEDTTDMVREGVSIFTRFKSWLGLRIEYNVLSQLPRFFVTAEVRARTDKFYLIELEKGPLGDFPEGQLTNVPGMVPYTRTQQINESLRFTAQFGKTFSNTLQVRGGIKESTFGFGADLLLGEGRLRLSADLYGSYERTPRLKLAGALAVFHSVYLIAGVDDALNPGRYLPIAPTNSPVPTQFDRVRVGRDYFLGATLHFNDADLAVLLRVYGALVLGLL